MSGVKVASEPGEWVDPAVPLPDHPVRKTLWWAIVNRLPRPALWWVTLTLWAVMAVRYGWLNQIPPLEWFSALAVWSAALFGVTTYEKRLGIN